MGLLGKDEAENIPTVCYSLVPAHKQHFSNHVYMNLFQESLFSIFIKDIREDWEKDNIGKKYP